MFTKKKFLTFTSEKQHKKCSEILKLIYEALLANTDCKVLIDHYNEIRQWMNAPPLNANFQDISNEYHLHLRLAKKQHQEHNLLPFVKKGDKETAKKTGSVCVYLDHLRSAHNVGSIIRTVEAFSLGSIYFSPQTPNNLHKQVKDASMGTSEWISCFSVDLPDALPKPIIALETCQTAVSLYDFIFPDVFTLIVGNEEYGCSDDTLKIADVILEIPLVGRKNSLNVANAFAIVANEIQRQKRLK